MPKKIDWQKLKKDELLKKIGAKLNKDQLAQLAEGLHTGTLSADTVLSPVSGTVGEQSSPPVSSSIL